MPHPDSAAWPADLRFLEVKATGRLLNTGSVGLLAVAAAVFACALQLSALERTGMGILIAALMIAGGALLSRWGNRSWWCGTSVMGAGYVLAYFFAQATHYISGIAGFDSPYPCWFLVLGLTALANVQATRNTALRWAALPFTVGASGWVLLQALSSTETVGLFGFTMSLPAVASVCGMFWWAALAATYDWLHRRADQGDEHFVIRGWYRVGHEILFVLAAVNALALPKFCSTLEQAPLWWSLEMPVLLLLCWNSKSFVKHGLIMGVWGLSAAMLLFGQLELAPLMRMAVPLSGLAMAMSYRFAKSTRDMKFNVWGYSVYLYGASAVAIAVPFMHVGHWDAMPYLLVETGILLTGALLLKDRILLGIASVLAVVSLLLYGAHFREWVPAQTVTVVVGCYVFNLVFMRLNRRGNLSSSPYVPLPFSHSLSAKEAFVMEIVAAGCGFAAFLSGTLFLLHNPWNTGGWGVASLALIAYGFLTGRVGHRATGLLAMALATYKLVVFDLSGTEGATRAVISSGAIGVCALTASLFYLNVFVRGAKNNNQEPPGSGDPPSGTDQPQGGADNGDSSEPGA